MGLASNGTSAFPLWPKSRFFFAGRGIVSLPVRSCLALLLVGCTVPTLAQLEAEKPRACDGDHPCVGGESCTSGGFCVAPGQECAPNSTQPCGSNKGECQQGTQSCSADGKLSAHVHEVYPLERTPDALKALSNRQVMGKILLRP